MLQLIEDVGGGLLETDLKMLGIKVINAPTNENGNVLL
jgi:hypothetical protein